MKKIIVPVDFSEHSEYALETAAAFAKKYDAEILALHMLEISETILTKDEVDLDMETAFFLKLAEKKFDGLLSRDYLNSVSVIPIIKHFKVFSEVNDVAKEHGADLIVMGSHGVSGLKEVFVGSNTERVVRHAEIPVIVVKHCPILTDVQTAVFACDFSQDSIEAYRKASLFFDKLQVEMQIVYVNLPDNRFLNSTEMEKRVAGFLSLADGNLDKMHLVSYVNDYSIEKGILNYANVIGADLIAVATHGRKGLSHFFAGSVSEDIANHSTLPVMTLKI